MEVSRYRTMWLIVLFDLPTDSEAARRRYTTFRKFLLRDGFNMLQYSVYGRYCSSRENTDVHMQRIRQIVPADGEVRILTLTDKQFEKQRIFRGKRRVAAKEPPQQLQFF